MTIDAGGISVGICEVCDAELLHIGLTDDSGEDVAALAVDLEAAREIIARLTHFADRLEASALRQTGMLT